MTRRRCLQRCRAGALASADRCLAHAAFLELKRDIGADSPTFLVDFMGAPYELTPKNVAGLPATRLLSIHVPRSCVIDGLCRASMFVRRHVLRFCARVRMISHARPFRPSRAHRAARESYAFAVRTENGVALSAVCCRFRERAAVLGDISFDHDFGCVSCVAASGVRSY